VSETSVSSSPRPDRHSRWCTRAGKPRLALHLAPVAGRGRRVCAPGEGEFAVQGQGSGLPRPLSRRALRPRRPLPASGARHRVSETSVSSSPRPDRHSRWCTRAGKAGLALHLAPVAGRGRRVCAPGEGSLRCKGKTAAPNTPLPPGPSAPAVSPRKRGEAQSESDQRQLFTSPRSPFAMVHVRATSVCSSPRPGRGERSARLRAGRGEFSGEGSDSREGTPLPPGPSAPAASPRKRGEAQSE
jgi:hypothetical protein